MTDKTGKLIDLCVGKKVSVRDMPKFPWVNGMNGSKSLLVFGLVKEREIETYSWM